jgi:hypothetical protein
MNRTWQSLTIIGLVGGLLLTACGTADPTPRPREEQIAQLTQVAAAVSGTAAARSATQTAQAIPTTTPTLTPTPTVRAATATPTQIARPAVTSTASGNRPASDSGSGTSATRVVPATPSPRAVKSMPPGVLFDDDLTQPGQPWLQGLDPCGQAPVLICQDPQGLRARIQQPGKQLPIIRSGNIPELNDMVIDLDVTVLDTDKQAPGGYGLMCRYQAESGRGYLARVWADGRYSIYKIGPASESRLGSAEEESSPVINQGVASNHLTFSCIGTTLTLAINGTEVLRVTDDDPKRAAGMAQLYACTCRGGALDVVFNHVTLTIPEKSASSGADNQRLVARLAPAALAKTRGNYVTIRATTSPLYQQSAPHAKGI